MRLRPVFALLSPGDSRTTAAGELFSCSSSGKWSSLAISKGGWLWYSCGGQRSQRGSWQNRFHSGPCPLLWLNAKVKWHWEKLHPPSQREVCLSPLHKGPLHVLWGFSIPLSHTLLTGTGNAFSKKEFLNKTHSHDLMNNRGLWRTLGVSWASWSAQRSAGKIQHLFRSYFFLALLHFRGKQS